MPIELRNVHATMNLTLAASQFSMSQIGVMLAQRVHQKRIPHQGGGRNYKVSYRATPCRLWLGLLQESENGNFYMLVAARGLLYKMNGGVRHPKIRRQALW
jgi:hypothetical protein